MATYGMQTIADLDEARRNKRMDEMKVVIGRPDLADSARLKFTMSVLQYNQGFVTFIDNKANSLLLVNSIFLATLAASGLGTLLALGAVTAAAMCVLLSLGVVWARGTAPGSRDRGQLIFFAHIRRRRGVGMYLDDLQKASAPELVDNTARQVFELAGVVERKFKAYRWAQMATALSAALWISNLIAPALNR